MGDVVDFAKPEPAKLAALAARINAEHEQVEQAVRRMLERAREAGKLLLEAKAALNHGEWGPWLSRNCSAFSARTARLYMWIATRSDLEIGIAAKFGLRAGVAFLKRVEGESGALDPVEPWRRDPPS